MNILLWVTYDLPGGDRYFYNMLIYYISLLYLFILDKMFLN